MSSTPWIRRGTKDWLLQSEHNRMSQLRGRVFRPTMVARNQTHYVQLDLILKDERYCSRWIMWTHLCMTEVLLYNNRIVKAEKRA